MKRFPFFLLFNRQKKKSCESNNQRLEIDEIFFFIWNLVFLIGEKFKYPIILTIIVDEFCLRSIKFCYCLQYCYVHYYSVHLSSEQIRCIFDTLRIMFCHFSI